MVRKKEDGENKIGRGRTNKEWGNEGGKGDWSRDEGKRKEEEKMLEREGMEEGG